MKCQIGQLRNVLGTSVKCTNKGTIPIRSEKLYHELCSWPSRERIVASTFFERLSVQVKKKKITAMSYSSTKDAWSLVCKLLWWFDHERLTISRKSGWRERMRFLNPKNDTVTTDDRKQKWILFKPFYSYCDISKVSLAKRKAPKVSTKKRRRGGKTVARKKKNKRIKKAIEKSPKN